MFTFFFIFKLQTKRLQGGAAMSCLRSWLWGPVRSPLRATGYRLFLVLD